MTGRHAAARGSLQPLRMMIACSTWLLGAAGVVVLAWLAFSLVTGAQVVIFKSGSMSPTMPTGSAAISLPVAATELHVGDVITVRRPGEALPVTHRVVQLGPATGQSREVILQGDANDEPDARPYQIDHALRVVWTVPGLGPALADLKSPLFMTTLTIVTALIVVAAFWPRSGEEVSRSSLQPRQTTSDEVTPA